MKYRLIGIDLDGTLLGGDGRISAANRRAIESAQEAGVLVVPCTGRAWRESRRALADMPEPTVGVFVTGAVVNDIPTGEPIHHRPLEPDVAFAMVDRLHDSPEAVLVFRESTRAGHDYLVTGRGELVANTAWWFEHSGAAVHHQRDLTADDLNHALRIGMVASATRMREVVADLGAIIGENVVMHYFPAVQMPGDAEPMYVLEVFADGVHKGVGIEWVGAEHGIAMDEIAVIGDEINDIQMVEAAGCGIAMGNAIDRVKDAASYVTRRNDEDGVAHAIERLLSGEWDAGRRDEKTENRRGEVSQAG